MNFDVTIGEKLNCPICGKQFIASDDTKYIIGNAFTCDWKCFLNEVKRMSLEKKKK